MEEKKVTTCDSEKNERVKDGKVTQSTHIHSVALIPGGKNRSELLPVWIRKLPMKKFSESELSGMLNLFGGFFS